jgi:8-oxo-dGTP diphosphatase
MAETRTLAKALLVADNKILILRRSDTDDRRPLQWDLPGGGVDPEEDIKQACSREILEEAGLSVPATELKVMHAMSEVAESGESATWIVMRASVKQSEIVLSYEHSEFRWVTLEEALNLFEYPRQLRMLQYVYDNSLLQAQTSD